MNPRIETFQNRLANRRAVKIIAGIANFDLENVLDIVHAATIARASAVDVAARADIVHEVRKITDLTVFASSIQPRELLEAVENGADVAELGNYDALYEQGLFLTHDDVMKLARETVELIDGRALISITIPGHLCMETQIRMAKALEEMGVDMIQTEGASRALSIEPSVKALSREEKASISLKNTRMLSQNTSIPVMAASGIDLDTVEDAFDAGASALGVGSAINKLSGEREMLERTEQIMLAVAANRVEQPMVASQVS